MDKNTGYADIDAFYTSIYGDGSITLWNDLDRTRTELITLAPEDGDEINKLLDNVELSKEFLFPAEKPLDMMGIRDYISMGRNMKDVPKVMKEYGSISLEELALRFRQICHPAYSKGRTSQHPDRLARVLQRNVNKKPVRFEANRAERG